MQVVDDENQIVGAGTEIHGFGLEVHHSRFQRKAEAGRIRLQ